jgi:hypothetical protein
VRYAAFLPTEHPNNHRTPVDLILQRLQQPSSVGLASTEGFANIINVPIAFWVNAGSFSHPFYCSGIVNP